MSTALGSLYARRHNINNIQATLGRFQQLTADQVVANQLIISGGTTPIVPPPAVSVSDSVFVPYQHVLYVNQANSLPVSQQNGLTVPTAFTNLQSALSLAVDNTGWNVQVLAGTYTPAGASGYTVPSGASVILTGDLNGPTYIDGLSVSRAGLLTLSNSNVVIQNMTVRNALNSTYNTPGAAILASGSTLGFQNVTFTNNVNNAQVYTIPNTSPDYTLTGGAGAGVYASNSNLYFSKCDFDGNRAHYGGAVASLVLQASGFPGVCGFQDCSFTGNVSDNWGGAVALSRVLTFNLDNCAFFNNSCGGIAYSFSSVVFPYGTSVVYEQVPSGGAVSVNNVPVDLFVPFLSTVQTVANVTGCTFGGNTVSVNNVPIIPTGGPPPPPGAMSYFLGSGGGFGGQNVEFTCLNGTFEFNQSLNANGNTTAVAPLSFGTKYFVSQGGAISLRGSTSPPYPPAIDTNSMSIVDSTFTGNSANYGIGGAVAIVTGYNSFTFRSCSFERNTALIAATSANNLELSPIGSGGAVTIGSPSGFNPPTLSTQTVVFDTCLFTKNSCTGTGGSVFAIQSTNGTWTITNCQVDRNECFDCSGFNVFNWQDSNTNTSSINVSGCTFSDNKIVQGAGGLLVSFFRNVTTQNCSFLRNTCSRLDNSGPVLGGGLYYVGVRNGLVIDSNFVGNKAVGSQDALGGALYADRFGFPPRPNSDICNLTVQTCTFTDNHVSGVPGGLFANAIGGGAVYCNEIANVELRRNNYSNNTANGSGTVAESDGAGGAVYIYDATTVNIHGDQILFPPSTLYQSFYKNSATSTGGAIWIRGSTTSTIDINSFNGDSAPNGGAKIYIGLEAPASVNGQTTQATIQAALVPPTNIGLVAGDITVVP